MQDILSGADVVIDEAHHETHDGAHFSLTYSVADIGAMTTPDDTITLSFTTPNADKRIHLVFNALCSGGARLQFIEGKTGGGASPTGVKQSYNNKRDGAVSTILDVAGANASKVSYDATVFTGGTSLVDEYLTGTTLGANGGSSDARAEQEWLLKKNTAYQIALTLSGAVPGTLKMAWYETASRTI